MNPNLTHSRELELADIRRLYLREPGWKLGHKTGSEKEFCYMQNPGQNYYHRLLDGEIYVYSPEERLCLACAARRGILTFEAKALREPAVEIEIGEPVADNMSDAGYELRW
jgi:hypothetical protein